MRSRFFRRMAMVSVVASLLMELQFNSCFPPSLKQSSGRRGKTSCFILAALLLKNLALSSSRRSLALLLPPPPLFPLLLTSGPVKPLTGGEIEGAFMCVSAFAHVSRAPKCTRVCSAACVRATQCVLCLNPLSPKPYKAPCV